MSELGPAAEVQADWSQKYPPRDVGWPLRTETISAAIVTHSQDARRRVRNVRLGETWCDWLQEVEVRDEAGKWQKTQRRVVVPTAKIHVIEVVTP